ncbi:hypothetical protein F4821DRAFT_256682 [Hypoxylon rubiginosum]|uniref:Uncharacterized protein n=1 Tax=Hypoxylon rubiginosum TaxID=110542 RepID=A0ACC0DAE4_9PEZI|nr:hypothetical protein F4821DRAFT_256682 [Hypoxylon rubiginosum]
MKFVLALAIGMAAAAPTVQSTAEAALAKLLGHEGPQPKGISNGVGKGVQTGDSGIANINKEKNPRQDPDQNPLHHDRDKLGLCGVGGVGELGPTQEVAKELRLALYHMPGSCNVGPGPGKCSRLQCDRGAATWLCNDNTTPIGPQCRYLSNFVAATIYSCEELGPDGHNHTKGQQFIQGNFNVILGPDPSC